MSGARKRTRDQPIGSSRSESGKRKSKSRKEEKQSSSLLSTCFKTLVFVLMVLGAVALFGYYRAPFTALTIPDYVKEIKLEGNFALNKKLAEGTKHFGLLGPESIEEDEKGNLYTGLDDGRIVRIAPSSDGVVGMGKVYTLMEADKMPKIIKSSRNKGRPLGVRLLKDTLYVADAYFGIYSLDLKNNDVTSLVAPDAISPGIGFADDLCFTKNRDFVYFTDASSKYGLDSMMPYLLEGLCDGRILQYNMKTKEIRTVMSDLCLPNGIQLSSDDKLLFVSETFRYRMRVIDMTTWKTTQFVDLPMAPDNIRPTGKGTYWIAGGSPWTPMTEFIQKYAFVRQIIAGLLSYDTVFKNFPMQHNFVIEMNEEGEILQTLHDPEGELTRGLAQASTLKDGRLVLGSFFKNQLSFSESKFQAIGTV